MASNYQFQPQCGAPSFLIQATSAGSSSYPLTGSAMRLTNLSTSQAAYGSISPQTSLGSSAYLTQPTTAANFGFILPAAKDHDFAITGDLQLALCSSSGSVPVAVTLGSGGMV